MIAIVITAIIDARVRLFIRKRNTTTVDVSELYDSNQNNFLVAAVLWIKSDWGPTSQARQHTRQDTQLPRNGTESRAKNRPERSNG